MFTFTYRQNNSFGEWAPGMPKILKVTAESVEEADSKAESLGVYFDGCEKGIDCPCCGDRWYRSFGADDNEDV
jgi:hypothetical protein